MKVLILHLFEKYLVICLSFRKMDWTNIQKGSAVLVLWPDCALHDDMDVLLHLGSQNNFVKTIKIQRKCNSTDFKAECSRLSLQDLHNTKYLSYLSRP